MVLGKSSINCTPSGAAQLVAQLLPSLEADGLCEHIRDFCVLVTLEVDTAGRRDFHPEVEFGSPQDSVTAGECPCAGVDHLGVACSELQ